MQLHVKTKRIALCGVCAAIGVILVSLGAFIENATLFFLALAAFICGALIRLYAPGYGAAYMVSVTVLSFLLAPGKLYVFTFLAFSLYILLAEFLEKNRSKLNIVVIWLIKLAVYNLMLFAVITLGRFLLGTGIESFVGSFLRDILQKDETLGWIMIALFMQFFLVAFDRIYFYYIVKYMPLIKEKLDRSSLS